LTVPLRKKRKEFFNSFIAGGKGFFLPQKRGFSIEIEGKIDNCNKGLL
jgi:hypothetical protein